MTEGYVEFHARSAFSFLEGSSTPEELISTCKELGGSAMALLDRDGLYGAPRFHMGATKFENMKAHIGAEITLALEGGHTLRGKNNDSPAVATLPLLVENRTGYQNLCRLITRMKLRAPKHAKPGETAATFEDLAEYAEGLVCLTGGDDGPLEHALQSGGLGKAITITERLVHVFGPGNVYAELQRHFNRQEESRNQAVVDMAGRFRLPLLATNGVCYASAARRQLADVFTCLRNHVRLDTAGQLLARNSERYLKSASQMLKLFADLPKAIAHTRELSARLGFTLKDLGYEFPKYPVPSGETMDSFLRKHTYKGARERYTGAHGMPTYQRALQQIDRELALIERLQLAGYFLIIWDLINFCRDQKILVQGRGSAANSAVCFSLGITAVDPVGMELLFERFLSAERQEWPDVDLDLPSGPQRERVIQYVYERYGNRGAAMTANTVTYRGRSAAREVGKVMGFDEETIKRLSRLVGVWEWRDPKDTPERLFNEARLNIQDRRIRKFLELYQEVQNLPRHLSQHPGGMIISEGQLDSIVPLEPATMPGRVIAQWDKDDCTDMKIIKVDLLGLGMMAAIEECVTLIKNHYHEEIDLAHLPQDDPQVYAALRKADTVGWFQVESRAQMSSLPRMRPERFYDIVVQVAIIRPGPIVGNMTNPYLNRRLGREKATCLHPSLEPVLARTLGVPIFQEQLLRMAMIVAGFTGGEAEELRRAMGFKRSGERMREIEIKLRRGMNQNGITGESQDRIVQAITSFALYGFPESHAASFALIAYASGYLKCHYLAAFVAATLNNQPMGFYNPFTIIKDAQRHGLKVSPVDVTRSNWECTLEGDGRWGLGAGESSVHEPRVSYSTNPLTPIPQLASPQPPIPSPYLRLGLRYVKGLREEAARAIVRERTCCAFADVDDLHNRVPELRKNDLRRLAEAGALNFLDQESIKGQRSNRRSALWEVERAGRAVGPLLKEQRDENTDFPLQPMTIAERVNADFRVTGLTIGRHPIGYRRQELNGLGVKRAIDLQEIPDGDWVRVAGWVVCRQRPGTAKGFVFLSLEDETGIANVIVTPDMFDRNRELLVSRPLLMIDGKLQNQDNVIHVKARRVHALSYEMVTAASHDFR